MNLQEIKALDGAHVMQTYGRANVAFAKGEGARLYDTEGKEYIDFGSGIGVASLGYGDPAWVSAVSAQAATLAHTSNLYYNPSSTAAGAKLASLAGEGARVFFGNSGAEANEGVIKAARKYSFDKYGPGRADILTLRNSFHGRTVTTLAATGQEAFHQFFFPFTEGFVHAEPTMEDIQAKTTGSICAVLFECVQGEGGVIPLEQDFVSALAAYAAERDWLLLVDEVQTGVGRTGTLFSFEQYGIKPDLFSLAKGLGGGLPVGAVVAGAKCANVLTVGMHASTFGANPVSLAGVSVVLDRVSDPAFLQSVVEKGDYIAKKLSENKSLPIAAIRHRGLMFGVDLEGVSAKDAAAALLEKGLVALTAKQALRFLPPLTITYDEIDRGLAIFEEVLAKK